VTLAELLIELRENMLHDRSDQVAGSASDYLWSDATLTQYINQAYFRFAREALCIRDAQTPNITTFKTAANQQTYQLDPSVIAVISARVVGEPCDLARAGHSDFGTYHTPDSYFFDPSQLSNLPPGKPLAFGTDEYLGQTQMGTTSAIVMYLYPMVSPTYAGLPIQLRVVREPVSRLTNPTDLPELPMTHHLEMLDWAAYLALRVVDHDAGDPVRAQEFKASFEDATRKARLLAMRKMFTPLQHGFGRGGWSWEGNGYGI
jgi:hypothetical protein